MATTTATQVSSPPLAPLAKKDDRSGGTPQDTPNELTALLLHDHAPQGEDAATGACVRDAPHDAKAELTGGEQHALQTVSDEEKMVWWRQIVLAQEFSHMVSRGGRE